MLKKPWISKCLLVSIKKRHKLFKSHLLSKDLDKIKQYKIYNNKLNKLKDQAKKNYFTAQFNLNKHNIKATWGLIGMLINRKKNSSTSTNQLFFNNRIYTDKRDICEHLNTHFINVGSSLAAQTSDYSNLNPTQYFTRSFSNSFMFRAINVQEVKDLLQNLKINKASISIPNKCIKLAVDHISEALTEVFNYSLVQGIMPDILKVSRVTPIDKGGDAVDPSNFRPIATLYSFAQIFEKLVYSQVLTYIEKYDILDKFQFGFRKGRSTEQAIVEISENLKKAIDNNLYSCGFFLDFAKAFDTVNHQILLKKLETYGIRGIPLKWFTSYLFNRQQYVSLNSVESSKQTMKCGIPQGSSLGPLLFLLYINDISNCSDKLNFRIFADDTNVFASSPSIRDLEKLINEELAKIKEWCDLNKLSINIKKTNYMIVKSPKKKSGNINIKLPNKDGNSDIIEKKRSY